MRLPWAPSSALSRMSAWYSCPMTTYGYAPRRHPTGNFEIDDAYIGGERTGEGAGRGRLYPLYHGGRDSPGHTSGGRRQTSATLPGCLRLALQSPLCPENNPRHWVYYWASTLA